MQVTALKSLTSSDLRRYKLNSTPPVLRSDELLAYIHEMAEPLCASAHMGGSRGGLEPLRAVRLGCFLSERPLMAVFGH